MAGHHSGSHCFPKKDIVAHLRFAKDHLYSPQHLTNVLLTDKTNIELFGKNKQHTRKDGVKKRVSVHENIVPKVLHDDLGLLFLDLDHLSSLNGR